MKGYTVSVKVQIKFTHFLSLGFPDKLTLRQKHASRKIVGECPRE